MIPDPTNVPRTERWRPRAVALPAIKNIPLTALGLMLVLIVLAGFAIWSALMTRNAAARATHATELSQLFNQANAAVAAAESLERKYRLEPSPAVLAKHRAAAASLVDALTMVSAQEGSSTVISDVLALHARYLDATTRLFAAVDAGDSARVLAIDGSEVDPLFDRIAVQVNQVNKEHQAEAAQAMRDLTNTESLVVWTTPIVFAAGLILILILGGRLRALRERLDVATQREVKREVEHILLNAERDAALAASAAKSTFLATMSHELRTPLTAILGYSELLMLQAQRCQYHELTRDISQITTSGQHLLSLINDVLDLSKIEAGKMEVSLDAIQIRELVDEIVATSEPLVVKNNNRLTVLMADDLQLVHSDATKIRQILLNLMSNAAKFTQDGAILLQVDAEHHPDGAWIRFIVRDTGIGISADQLAGLFQPFTQIDSSATRRYGGTGLGLALCQRLCTLLGGQITLESTPGIGSTVTVVLPAHLVDASDDGSTHFLRTRG